MKCLMVLIALMLPLAVVHAQSVYKWVDESGKVHYSTVLPPEVASARQHQRLTADGLVAESYERVQTDEELAELEARKQAEAEAQAREELEQQQNRLFLAAFPTERDVQRAFGGRRETLLNERRSMHSLRETTRDRFGELVEQAAEFERRGEPVPAFLVEQVERQRAAIRQINERIANTEERLATLERDLEDQLERHRQLTRPAG